MMKLGPREMKGLIWDDRGKTKIHHILISHENSAVFSIQFVYIVDGKVVPSEVHGTARGSKFDVVTFDHPREYLTSVSGHYAMFGNDRLRSITFGTNKRKYGPFGKVSDDNDFAFFTPFVYNFGPSCLFGGFHGSDYNSGLNAIGIYVKASESVGETEAKAGRMDKK